MPACGVNLGTVSTAPPDIALDRLDRARWARRAFFAALTGFLLLGLLGVLGVRTADVRAEGGGYELSVHHARVTRSGLATPWSVQVRRPGGLGVTTIEIATSASYFDVFDENSLDPEPSQAASDGDRMVWTFEVPEGAETFEVSLDARIEPGVQMDSIEATTELIVEGSPVASVSYETFVMP